MFERWSPALPLEPTCPIVRKIRGAAHGAWVLSFDLRAAKRRHTGLFLQWCCSEAREVKVGHVWCDCAV